MLRDHDTEFATLFNDVKRLAERIATRVIGGNFKPDGHQSLICSEILHNDNKFMIAHVKTGGGKTYILMLLALFFAEVKDLDVLILTCSPFLES